VGVRVRALGRGEVTTSYGAVAGIGRRGATRKYSSATVRSEIHVVDSLPLFAEGEIGVAGNVTRQFTRCTSMGCRCDAEATAARRPVARQGDAAG
jgi:hypothetical protein